MESDARDIVVLTGAGISKESGLETFRDAGGLWARVRVEDVATPDAFARDPARVLAFYNHRRQALLDPTVRPNRAHEALARLERNWPGSVLVITQNIDDLHERAGTRAVIHMHGELLKARCTACGEAAEWRADIALASTCPVCATTGRLRPDVVWFGEMPRAMDAIAAALSHCHIFVAIGTSGSVYPAAGFVQTVRERGRARRIEVNLDPSDIAELFQEHWRGPASEQVPALVDALLEDENAR